MSKFYLEASNLAASNENAARLLMKVCWQQAGSPHRRLISQFLSGNLH